MTQKQVVAGRTVIASAATFTIKLELELIAHERLMVKVVG